MRTFINYICIVMAAVWFCGCGTSKGSGNVLTQMRDVDDFDFIRVSGVQQLIFTQGSDVQVKITADDNVINSVVTYANNGHLMVENRSNMVGTDIQVYVTAPSIRGLDVQGRVAARFDGKVAVQNFDMRLEGSGTITIPDLVSTSADGIKVFTKGSGTVTLGGSSKSLKLKIEGSGSVFAEKMVCPDILAKMLGPGSVFVSSDGGVLAVSVEGAGSLFYSGKPRQLNKQIKGTGNVLPR